MAYARRHGNQIAIVHGERDAETGAVHQHVLFTLYSKEEAREALGGEKGNDVQFKQFLEEQYPDISFNWRKLKAGIKANLDALPEQYAYKKVRLVDEFREKLCGFARQLILADPQVLFSSAELIQEHRQELEYLSDLIRWRLKLCEQDRNEWNTDNHFFWRYKFQGSGVPPGAEGFAESYYDKNDLDRAEAAFGILTECFDDYADGHNYLGAIALDKGHAPAALEHFRRAVQIGRRCFPKRISKDRYWSDHGTRPYMRGLRNLASVLNETSSYAEALDVCTRLEDECQDALTAAYQKAMIYLNTRQWQKAAEAALHVNEVWPEASFVAGLALLEMSDMREGLTWLLHGALNSPRAARMLAGEATGEPTSASEANWHNTGVELRRGLNAYLEDERVAGIIVLEHMVSAASTQTLLDEIEGVVRSRERNPGDRGAFERMTEMRTPEYARQTAQKLFSRLPANNSHGNNGR